jgi:translation initiation factor 2 alpha subunit (eIF-2alpha)
VGNNQIEEIEGVAHLSELEEFWVRHIGAGDDSRSD